MAAPPRGTALGERDATRKLIDWLARNAPCRVSFLFKWWCSRNLIVRNLRLGPHNGPPVQPSTGWVLRSRHRNRARRASRSL